MNCRRLYQHKLKQMGTLELPQALACGQSSGYDFPGALALFLYGLKPGLSLALSNPCTKVQPVPLAGGQFILTS